MKALFLSVAAQATLEPAYGEFLAAIGDRYPVELYHHTKPLAEQLEAVEVVVDHGGWATREMIDAGRAAGVKLWQVLGYGLDHVDVQYVLDSNLLLAHTPGQCTAVALAEHALFLMLCLEKNLHESQNNLRRGIFCRPINEELCGKTLGVIGLGASGCELARRARSLGMRVIAVDIVDVPEVVRRELDIQFFGNLEDLGRVLEESDYVSIHTPLTSSTRHLIDERALDQMKPTGALINVARGAIVDEIALIEALRNRRIRGAGLDVFTREPLDVGHPLLELENVIATPHIAGITRQASRRRAEVAAENVRRVAQGRPPLYQVTSAW